MSALGEVVRAVLLVVGFAILLVAQWLRLRAIGNLRRVVDEVLQMVVELELVIDETREQAAQSQQGELLT